MNHSPKAVSNPKISFLVPNYNEAKDVICKSIDSIRDQAYDNYECIFIDESTDLELAGYCESLCELDSRFKYVRPNRRLGLVGSLNLGLELAKSDWIARFDSDDICAPDRIQRQVDFILRHPEVDVVGGAIELIDGNGLSLGKRRYPLSHQEIQKKIHFTTVVAHPAVMYRKAAVDSVGGYDSSYKYAEDLDLWLRLLNAGFIFANLDDVLIKFRQKIDVRSNVHWKQNIRARVSNFKSKCAAQRICGIIIMLSWLLIPASVKGVLYKNIVLLKTKKKDKEC